MDQLLTGGNRPWLRSFLALLFVLAGLIVAAVLGQSVYFLLKALKRSKTIGMDQKKIMKTIRTAAIFTIAPAVAIVISVIALSKSLGLPLPWLRLSVVGSLSYETIAAENAVSAMGLTLGKITELTAQQYVNISLVMTISILVGIWLVPVIGKRLLGGMAKLENRDAKWADALNNAMFIGMIAAFLGFVFCDFSRIWNGDANGMVTVLETVNIDGVKTTVEKLVPATSGLIPVCVMGVSAVVMALCGLAMNKLKLKWMGDYALPISLLLGMAAAIPITAWLG